MTFRDRLRRIPLLAWIAGPVALAALVAWPLGGWDTVALVSREVPRFASNQVLEGHRFDLRVDDAWVAHEHPAVFAPEPGQELLIVRVEVTNRTGEPEGVTALRGYVVPPVPDSDGAGSPFYALVADGTSLPELNPGLPRTIDIIWTIPAGAVAVGDDLRIGMYDSLPRSSFVYYGVVWDTFLAGIAERNVSER